MSTLVTDNIKPINGTSKKVEDLLTEGELALFGGVTSFSDFIEMSEESHKNGDTVILLSFFDEYKGVPAIYVYNDSVSKSDHNGRGIVSPTVPPLSQQDKGVIGFFQGNGDTGGTGAFVRVKSLKEGETIPDERGYYELYYPNFPMGDQFHEKHDGFVYNGQAVHPDCIRIKGGFGPQEFEYWLALTGWIEFDDYTENPMVFASHDGLRWEIPAGATNPLEEYTGAGGYYSDVDILYAEGSLKVYYRETPGVPADDSEILLKTSTDGVNWNSAETVTGMPTDGNKSRISPAFTYEDGTYFCWILTVEDGPVARLTSQDGINFSGRQDVTLIDEPSEGNLWHLNVNKVPEGHAMVTVQSPYPSEIRFWMSYDGGLTFEYVNTILERENIDRESYFYRSALVFNDDFSGAGMYLTQGTGGIGGNFKIAYAELVFDDDGKLLPIRRSGDKQVTRDTIVAPSAYIENLHVGRVFGGNPYVLLGYRKNQEGGPTTFENGVEFDYLAKDPAGITRTPIGENYSGQEPISKVEVPEGYFEVKATFQLGLKDIAGEQVTSGVQVNGDSSVRYGLPSVTVSNQDNVNANGHGSWTPVVPGDKISLDVIIGGSSNVTLNDSTWLSLEFR